MLSPSNLASSQAQSQAQPRVAATDNSPAHVLVLDELRPADQGVSAQLRSWGHDVQTARTWDDSLRQATESPPQAVVINLGTRTAQCLKAVRLMRLLPGLQEALIVVLRKGAPYRLEVPSRTIDPDQCEARPLTTDEFRDALVVAAPGRCAYA
jgi:CheY-like chemotaxis protein